MKNFSLVIVIFILIISTTLVKNSTKKIDDDIFATKENLRLINKQLGEILLEFNYLSSGEELSKLQEIYFKDQFIKRNLKDIKIIRKIEKDYKIEELNLN